MQKTRTPSLFGISDDFHESFLSLDQLLISRPEATYFFRASNNQLAPDVVKNDILIVDRSLSPKTGDIVVLYHYGERLCRRWPCPLEDSEIFGVVTAHIREHRKCSH